MVKGEKAVFTCGCKDPCLEYENLLVEEMMEGKQSGEFPISCWCHNCNKTKHFVMTVEIFENTDENDK